MNVLEILTATLFSSFVGSIHCVGMCGPFAIIAVGSNSKDSKVQRFGRLSTYHLGRLSTYLVMGALVSLVAWPIRSGFAGMELQRMLGWVAGAVLIGIGVSRLFSFAVGAKSNVSQALWLEQWTRTLVQSRRRMRNLPPLGSSYLWGSISTLLPCGWLYIFLLASISAPTTWTSLAMMFFFWVGTLPLLSLTTYSWSFVPAGWQSKVQPMIAVSIVAFGFFTLWNRSNADFATLDSPRSNQTTLEMIRATVNAKLPCCVHSQRVAPVSALKEQD